MITTPLLNRIINNGWAYILFCFLLILPAQVNSQCDSGSENTCQCETADILCTIDELDGYTFSMSDFQHPDDAPDPLCSSSDGVPNNPTWFAFVAWCEEIDLNVSLSNCEGVWCPFPFNFVEGVQIAIYSSCGPDWDEVDCDVNASDCNDTDDKELSLSGLNIGDVYYFLVDGCCGATCDIEVNIVGVCGQEEIEEWTDGIIGETNICIGSSETYEADDLDGANLFHWFLDGDEIDQTEDPEINIDWDEGGVFELCVDASNDPCVPIDDDPEPFCVTITVYEPDAGQITADPMILCPGESSLVSIENYAEEDGLETSIIVIDENDEIIQVGVPDEISVTSDICQTVTVCSYNYATDFAVLPEVGLDFGDIDCPSDCCDLECIDITFEDNELPEFPNAPASTTVQCYSDLAPLEDQEWRDNCDGLGLVPGTEDGSFTPCDGGTIERSWTYTDQCDNTFTYTQTIDITGIDPAAFTNLPANETISCEAIPSSYDDLAYTNNSSGDCLIEGFVAPNVDENYDPICGGDITLTWEFTDECDRTITHTQTITIDPAPEAAFIDTPNNMTISCADQSFTAEPLDFSNNTSGCLIEGTALPMVEDNSDVCGGTITVNWEFTDPCDRTISYTQVVTIEPSIPPNFIDPPANETIACDAGVPTFEDLEYTNNDLGDCLISGSVSPTIEDNIENCGGNITATWEYTDDCDRTITHIQTLVIDPPPIADFVSPPGNMTISCNDIPSQSQNLSYTNNDAICPIQGEVAPEITEDFDICGGLITYVWEYTDDCDRTINHVQVLTIEPAPQANFVNLPPDLSFTCAEFDGFTPTDVLYTNNQTGFCQIDGQVSGEVNGDITECGGTLTILYEFTDPCDRTISHTQTVTVEPAAQAAFANLPGPMSFACDGPDFIPEDLDYTNGESGDCEISGTISPIEAGDFDECGGIVSYIWTFTDECNRTISHTQVITYMPADDPVFTESPVDGILDCLGELPDDLELPYDNFLDFPCTIDGTVEPEITDQGTTLLLVWTYTNPCTGNTITEDQVLIVSTPVDFTEEDIEVGICEDGQFDLSTIPAIDQNNTDPTISYHDDFPPDPSNELSNPIVSPNGDMTYWIFGNNEFDCPDWIELTVNVENLSIAGSDNEGEICIEQGNMDLYLYISNDADFDGDFVQISGPSDLDVSDGDDVNIANAEPGTYIFEYIIEETDFCPGSIAIITIELLPEIEITLTDILCSDDFTTYSVSIEFEATDIDISAGEFDVYNLSNAVIINIPIDEVIEIEAENDETGCTGVLQIAPPNCDCPDVENPISNGNEVICFGEVNPSLSVSVNGNSTANWFDVQVGGTPLAEGTLSFTPSVTMPGTYVFYVETESLDDPGCVSQRIEVVLEILSPPNYNNTNIEVCDTDQDQIFSFDSLLVQSFVDISLSQTIAIYPSQTDAEQSINALSYPFINTVPANQVFYAVITNTAGCQTIIELDLVVYSKPLLDLEINNESCPNLNDGSVNIQNFDPTSNYFIDEIPVDNSFILSLSPGMYELIINDVNGCADTTQITIEDGFEHELVSVSIDCNDNQTNTDPNDDFYIISFELQNNQGNVGTFGVIDDNNNNLGTFAYGSTQMLTVPATGAEITLSFIDVNSFCSISETFGPLNPCSTNCIVTADLFDYVCFDNQTPSDPSDDYYEFQINVSAINGSSIDRYNVSINGVITYSFLYGELSTFIISADGSIVTIGITDAEDTACAEIINTEPLEPCSDDCLISVTVSNIICEDNGTDDINDDDIFFFDLLVTGLNIGTSFEIQETSTQYNYDEPYTIGPFDIINGDLNLTLIDNIDPNCTYSLDIQAPMACSDCNQTASLSAPEVLSCDEPTTSIEVSTSESAVYSWSGPDQFNSSNSIITVSIPGTYEVLITFFNGCTQTLSVDVIADAEIPIAVLGPDQLITCLVDSVLLDASQSIYPPGAIFEWTNSSNMVLSDQLSFVADQAGTYSFVIFDPASGCSSAIESVNVVLDADLPSVAIFADPGNILDCFVESINLTSEQEEDVVYTWLLAEQIIENTSISIEDPGTISLLALDTITGCENESQINILDLTEFPIVIIEEDGELDCETGSICLDASSSPFASQLDFVWYDPAGNIYAEGEQEICVQQGGSYTLELTDNINGCKNEESYTVDAPITINVELPASIAIQSGSSLDLLALIDIPIDQVSEIQWSPADILSCSDCLNPTVLEPADGVTITVEVTSISGCRSSASTILTEDIIVEVNIPNIINTSSNSSNGNITLYGNEFVESIRDFYIYDRWGNLVFETHNIEPNLPSLGWNGRFNGQLAEQGVYVYLFNILIVNGDIQTFGGDVTLLR